MNISVQVLYMYICFLLDKFLWVECVSHKVGTCLSLKENAKLFSKVVVPPAVYERMSCSTSSPTVGVVILLILAILKNVLWSLIVVLICISQVINDIKHLLMGLFAIYVSYLKCLFKSFECFIYYYYYCFWLCCVARRLLDPQPRIEPVPPGVEVWHPNHWTTRAFPEHLKIGLFSYWVLRILSSLYQICDLQICFPTPWLVFLMVC